jgi:hypothetical protein
MMADPGVSDAGGGPIRHIPVLLDEVLAALTSPGTRLSSTVRSVRAAIRRRSSPRVAASSPSTATLTPSMQDGRSKPRMPAAFASSMVRFRVSTSMRANQSMA